MRALGWITAAGLVAACTTISELDDLTFASDETGSGGATSTADAAGNGASNAGGNGSAGGGSPTTVSGTGGGGDGGWLNGYTRRKEITLKVGADDVPGFVLGVRRDGDTDLQRHAASDGRDIAFADELGQLLPFDIERWDAQSGSLFAWLPVSISSSATSTVYLYYDGQNSASQEDKTATWSNDFAGVWHLGGDPNASAPQVEDASGLLAHGSTQTFRGNGPELVDGIFGKGYQFTAGPSVAFGNPADGHLDFDTDGFSFAMWVNAAGSIALDDSPFAKATDLASGSGYGFLLGSGTWSAVVADNVQARMCTLGSETDNGGTWNHLAATVHRQDALLRCYVNGQLNDSQSLSVFGSVDTSGTVDVPGASQVFVGTVDELRVVDNVLKPSDIALHYRNMTDADAVYVIGAEEIR